MHSTVNNVNFIVHIIFVNEVNHGCSAGEKEGIYISPQNTGEKEGIYISTFYISPPNTGEKEGIYIGTFYISPQHRRNKHKKDLFSIISEEINISMLEQAQTKISSDTTNLIMFLVLKSAMIRTPGNSEDSITNPRGRELIVRL